MIYIKDGVEVKAKTYYDVQQLKKQGYVLKVNKPAPKKRGRPPKKVDE